MMKTFEGLFQELQEKIAADDPTSNTVAYVHAGIHEIGKKLLEEAGESWLAAEYEGKQKTAEELSQLLYFVMVMMLACGIDLKDVYRYL